ncbi:Ig-like domain-containing protein [Vogesella indigofera]|uniref:Ig-like domain-containing protein n=1 Tax=Vogesella indigofera TaxID=45465 RepID=UPI003F41BE9B
MVGPVDSNGAANLVLENAAVGSVVGVTAFATDADAGGQAITYTLSDDAGGRFAIDSSTGIVTVAGVLDYETATSHSITVLATSADGSSNSQSFSIDIGNVAPAAAVAITAITNDSGIVGDFITNDTTLVVSGTHGTLGAGEKVQVSSNGGLTWADVTVSTATTWSYTDPLIHSTNFTYQVRVVDSVGEVGNSASQAVTVDTTVPSVPTRPDLIATSDMGSSSTDNITNLAALTFTGTAEAGSTVLIFDGATLVGSGVAVGGIYTITTSTLSNSVHSITARSMDAAGNVSAASSALSVTVDTIAPVVTFTGANVNSDNMSGSITDVSGSGAASVTVFNNTTSAALGIDTTFPGNNWLISSSGFSTGNSLTATATDIAGNTSTASRTAPAGISGEPINLALVDPFAERSEQIIVTVIGAPSDWTLNEGIKNADGNWTVQTNDPSTLTITTASSFVGAIVLGVHMTWTNADGTTGSMYIADNVEAYAPGSPIFALSTDDNLTGSSAADTFVFARPIGNNVIHSFDVGADKVDLIGFAGVASMADLSIVNDGNGNAVVSIGSGQSIMLKGVDAALLTAANFQFDVTPGLHNAGTLTIADGAIMPLGGVIDNSGTIALAAASSDTTLELLFPAAELSGGGQLLLSDSAQNVIIGGTADTLLHNVDNTVSGAGQLGAGQLQLLNQGTIVASGSNALVINTGSYAVDNRGTLAATGSGGLLIESDVLNSGVLWANHGNVTVQGDVSGGGEAFISGTAVLALEGAVAQAQSVQFADDANGTLQLGSATAFDGSISGFDAGNRLALLDVAFVANSQLHYLANDDGSGGRLTVSDGINSAQLALDGVYAASGMQAGATGGSELSYSAPAVSHFMQGGLADDTLTGGAADDVLAGGKGNDTLQGGVGVDTFSWQLADLGDAGASRDVISDFDNRSVAEGGDIIDLHDLLPADNDLLAASLHFRLEDGSTVIEISPSGDSHTSQSIVLSGVDLLHDASSGQLLSDHDILQKMLDSGKLRHD